MRRPNNDAEIIDQMLMLRELTGCDVLLAYCELRLDGADYEIDLSAKNARAFRTSLALFVEHARKASRGPARRTARTSADRQRSGDVRAWAKDQGIAVSARGRIPASVIEQYQAAARGR